MKKLLTIIILLLGWFSSYGQTYTISYLQGFENNKVVSEGAITEDWLIVNESAKKITLKTIHPGAKDYIFKITKKRNGTKYSKEKSTSVDDTSILVYECELMNNNGIAIVWIDVDTFYQFIEVWSGYDIKNSTGIYQKYSYSKVE